MESGEYSQSNTSAYGYNSTITGKTWADATYEYDFRIVGTSGNSENWAGMQIRKTGPADDFYSGTGYLIFARNNGSVEILRTGASPAIIGQVNTGLSFTAMTHMKIAASGGNIKVYVNNHATPDLNVNDSTYAGGYVSLVTGKTHSHFDNVVIQW